ncbi:DUF1801 domain-containing protein [Spongiivirga sp. MCCC 1A20706]|uniref:DUF1801 domain-containing protein n=1 Tax=Spongiivirga sp. MCCC 1A20706 TaxID=3160963 RepID=UPI003977CCF0
MNPAERYILEQPEPFRAILLHLQSTIEKLFDEVELQYKYKIPFYYFGKRPFCYLNHTKDYVDVGFWNAGYITVHLEHLTSANRKVMKSLRYKSLEEINQTVLEEVLKNAFDVRDKKFY